jgi:ketosteroid isomerase-like protein
MLKNLFAIALIATLAGCASAPTGTPAADEPAVAAAVEKLRLAMIDPTRDALAALVADDLSYGHSGGKVDTKSSFIADLLSGASDFVTITITDQTIRIVDGGNVAIVRHTLAADSNDNGKPGKVLIKILGVWQKQAGQWKMVARQAIRPPA